MFEEKKKTSAPIYKKIIILLLSVKLAAAAISLPSQSVLPVCLVLTTMTLICQMYAQYLCWCA